MPRVPLRNSRSYDPKGLVAELVSVRRSESRRCTVPCGCKLENLLAILHDGAPAKADAVALQHRRVEHGLLSVGIKLHALGDGSQFFSLVERLGGAFRVLESNMYKHSQASLCLVLPPPLMAGCTAGRPFRFPRRSVCQAIRNRSLLIIEPVCRLPVRILKFTEQRPASERRLME